MNDEELRRLSDHLSIERVLAIYCRAVDRCDSELLKCVLSARVRERAFPDGLESGPNFRDGREAHGIDGGDAAADPALA
jgi:hypothetical protein